jgi:hypothetical protein
MKKKFLLLILIFGIFSSIIYLISIKRFSNKNFVSGNLFTLERSEGSCNKDVDCKWAGEGCGGGHGICTNKPKKYEGMRSTCDIVLDHPSNQGYICGCVINLNKCGWKK